MGVFVVRLCLRETEKDRSSEKGDEGVASCVTVRKPFLRGLASKKPKLKMCFSRSVGSS